MEVAVEVAVDTLVDVGDVAADVVGLLATELVGMDDAECEAVDVAAVRARLYIRIAQCVCEEHSDCFLSFNNDTT